VYEVFAPWDKSTHSDSLQLDVLSFLEKQYGTGFITLEHPERGKAFVKVDGNRRISIFKFDDRTVNAIFTDLTAEEALNAEKERRKRRAEELGS